MKKIEYLKQIESDFFKHNRESQETKELGKNIPCSSTVYHRAVRAGSKRREAIYEKYSYWQLDDIERKAREAIVRALSCGDRLDTKESKLLIACFHKAKDIKNTASKKIDNDIQLS